jgi:hypothetical protein
VGDWDYWLCRNAKGQQGKTPCPKGAPGRSQRARSPQRAPAPTQARGTRTEWAWQDGAVLCAGFGFEHKYKYNIRGLGGAVVPARRYWRTTGPGGEEGWGV